MYAQGSIGENGKEEKEILTVEKLRDEPNWEKCGRERPRKEERLSGLQACIRAG